MGCFRLFGAFGLGSCFGLWGSIEDLSGFRILSYSFGACDGGMGSLVFRSRGFWAQGFSREPWCPEPNTPRPAQDHGGPTGHRDKV